MKKLIWLFIVISFLFFLIRSPVVNADEPVSPFEASPPTADVYSIVKTSPHNYLLDLKIFIDDDIDSYVKLNKWLVSLEKEDTVVVSLHNFGGSVMSGVLVVNGLRDSKAHSIADVNGATASMGALIACSASEIKMGPFSFLMYHNGSSQISGKMSDIRYHSDAIYKLEKIMLGMCVDKGVLTDEQIIQILDGKDMYIFADMIKNEFKDKDQRYPLKDADPYLNKQDLSVIVDKLVANEPRLKDVSISLRIKSGDLGDGVHLYEIGVHKVLGGGYEIYFTKPSLQFSGLNKNWAAGHLAHELQHIIHGDLDGRVDYCHDNAANSRVCEKEADLAGKALAQKSGYDGCDIANYWKKWLEYFGDSRDSDRTHPSPSETIKYMECK